MAQHCDPPLLRKKAIAIPIASTFFRVSQGIALLSHDSVDVLKARGGGGIAGQGCSLR